MWCNADSPCKTMDRLSSTLHHISSQGKVVVVGHSLGGIYARELARRFSQLIACAILLGAPIRHPVEAASPCVKALELTAHLMNFAICCHNNGCDLCRPSQSELPPPKVPEVIIYSKSDGLVRWQNCIESGPNIKTIEVCSSHCGLPYNPQVLRTISEYLDHTSRHLAIVRRSPEHSNRREGLKWKMHLNG